jgi:hypothetical protein
MATSGRRFALLGNEPRFTQVIGFTDGPIPITPVAR